MNYQFSRELSLRAIFDYNGVLPNVTLVSLDKLEEFHIRQIVAQRIKGVILAHDPNQEVSGSLELLQRAGIPTVLLFSIAQILVSAFAKSVREAQTWLGLLQLVPVIPSIVLSIMPVKAQLWMFTVPLLSQQVAMTSGGP